MPTAKPLESCGENPFKNFKNCFTSKTPLKQNLGNGSEALKALFEMMNGYVKCGEEHEKCFSKMCPIDEKESRMLTKCLSHCKETDGPFVGQMDINCVFANCLKKFDENLAVSLYYRTTNGNYDFLEETQ